MTNDPLDEELLIQRLCLRDWTERDAEAFRAKWSGCEEFRDRVREHRELEHLLRFFGRLEKEPLGIEVDGRRHRIAESPNVPILSREKSSDIAEKLDFEEILRLATTERPKPGPTREPESVRWNAALRSACSRLGTLAERLLSHRTVATTIVVFLAVAGLATFCHEFLFQSPKSRQIVAHLSGFDDVVWGDCLAPILPGDPIERGSLRIESGSVALKLLNGAEIVLEGPAEFRIDGHMNVFLQNGYLSADVPPLTKKLRVGTPQLDIKVLGTAFWVKADPENTAVHLLRGRLELSGSSFGDLLLGAGEAFALPKQGKSRRFDAIKEDFTGSERVVAGTEATLRAWDAVDRGPVPEEPADGGDPSLRIHFDFERIGRTVPNMSPTGRRTVASGKLGGCASVEGHRTRSRGIAFRRLSDRIDLEVPGRLASMTLCCWVKIGRPVESRLPIFMSAGMPPGGVQWMMTKGGILSLNVVKTNSTPALAAQTGAVMTSNLIGCWVHLAAVVDHESGRVVFYRDGREIASRTIDFTPSIEIGPAMLGHWDLHRHREHVAGELSIDEFKLYDRALSPEEINQYMY